MDEAEVTCGICSTRAEFAVVRRGRIDRRDFHLYRCPACDFVFVVDPNPDGAGIYNDDYYSGKGADPLVNYAAEVSEARPLRRFEWSGILRWARSLTSITPATRWLDYGAGSGGLVTHLQRAGVVHCFAYEPSEAAGRLLARQPSTLDEAALSSAHGSFDVITAIEVIEHVRRPVDELRRIRELLAPGGVLLMTTTNARPYLSSLDRWRYVIPEIHLSYFTPRALAEALRRAGFRPEFPGYVDGWTEIIHYKVLKNLRRSRDGVFDRLVPWPLLGRVIDWRLELAAQPVGYLDGPEPLGAAE